MVNIFTIVKTSQESRGFSHERFNTYNSEPERHKEVVSIDICISNEIKDLWSRGIKTAGCCCGHGKELGFIEVDEENIKDMEELGYMHYIYDEKFGGVERKYAFIPKSYGHDYYGYSDGFLG